MILQPKRGMKDFLYNDAITHLYVIEVIKKIVTFYGFSPVITPLLESVDLFKRTVGENSDIIGKEMYTFIDKSADHVCLRPEGTASVMRAFLNSPLSHMIPARLYYHGSMFRYERPQKGRYRQFDQFGCELIGTQHPHHDGEMIVMASRILNALDIPYILNINTIGTVTEREEYKKKLVSFFNSHVTHLSAHSQHRLHTNPLRILDSKDPQDQSVVINAPSILDSLTHQSLDFYENVKDYLKYFHIPFEDNPRLVRGLDYYSHTTFEFKTQQLGSQDAIIAGGRYDDLSTHMIGKQLPSIGWAVGIDRLSLLCNQSNIPSQTAIAIIHLNQPWAAYSLCDELRNHHITSIVITRPNLKKAIQLAQRSCDYMIVIGDEEIKTQQLIIKSLKQTQNHHVNYCVNDIVQIFKKITAINN
jgi:histidyl-tRNA synthetase